MAKKNFDEERKKRKGHEFTLGGRTFKTNPGRSLTFLQSEAMEEDTPAYVTTLNFIRDFIVKEDRDQWDVMLQDSTTYLDVDDIINLSRWLMEVTSGDRPTEPPASSGNGDGPTESRSKERSSVTAVSGSKTSTRKKPSPSST